MVSTSHLTLTHLIYCNERNSTYIKEKKFICIFSPIPPAALDTYQARLGMLVTQELIQPHHLGGAEPMITPILHMT